MLSKPLDEVALSDEELRTWALELRAMRDSRQVFHAKDEMAKPSALDEFL
jgi:hypothetical protein